MEPTIICPLCGVTVIHQKHGAIIKTHIWSCRECPFIGFEYYSKKDTDNLAEYTERIAGIENYVEKRNQNNSITL